MKGAAFVLLLMYVCFSATAQTEEPPPESADAFEMLAESEEMNTDDDNYFVKLESLKRNPLNLNTAVAEDMYELGLLNAAQISNFFTYRKLLGNLIHIYELQAVPGWDLPTIAKVLPYVTLADRQSVPGMVRNMWKGGTHTATIRYAAGLQPLADEEKFAGTPGKIFFRYLYNYKGKLQFGVLGDKDGGEQFFKGAQKAGFDFYSFHLFLRKAGAVRAIALGDFTVNMGQGLIQWQRLSFKKSAAITNIKRQAPVLRPYTSAGEFNFMRGAGVLFGLAKWEAACFISTHNISANFDTDADGNRTVSSFLTSGYHRTADEIRKRKNLRLSVGGISVSRISDRFRFGLNSVAYFYSNRIEKQPRPDNLFFEAGSRFVNTSLDYAYTKRNVHFFGELAFDQHFNHATINGLLASLHRQIDATVLYRNISKGYYAPGGSAFTENAVPVNEVGWFYGLSFRPVNRLAVNVYADFFTFPWLRYLVSSPSSGREYLAEIRYQPDKRKEMYIRFKSKTKPENGDTAGSVMNYATDATRNTIRVHASVKISEATRIQSRYELSWWKREGKSEDGFLMYADLNHKPPLKPYAFSFRYAIFETTGTNSRIYAFESGLPMSFSVPQFSGIGWRYLVNASYRLIVSRRDRVSFTGSFSWSETAALPLTLPLINNGNKQTRTSQIHLQIIFKKN